MRSSATGLRIAPRWSRRGGSGGLAEACAVVAVEPSLNYLKSISGAAERRHRSGILAPTTAETG